MDLTFATYPGDSICRPPKYRLHESFSDSALEVVDIHKSIVVTGRAEAEIKKFQLSSDPFSVIQPQ
ncbi:MAG: hypothetical protein DME14_19220 [Candidatus Rokuibacteriota bacterium]|nr:MAG: hypothetical protein DME14_19220 [Candidatus Rokubacteria bacterium]